MPNNTSGKKYTPMSGKNYPAKLLLTGEYSVLKGGSAILLPLSIFGAKWTIKKPIELSFKKLLSDFIKYLENIMGEDKFLNLTAMEEAFNSGYILNSNVPQGCGLGSSGVFCAAIYDAFGIKTVTNSLFIVRDHLRLMENFFHGKSSGLDPLVSYYNQAILMQADQISIYQVGSPNNSNLIPEVWLLDSKLSRSTAVLVRAFEEYLIQPENRILFFETYMPLVEKATQQYLKGEFKQWYQTIQSISQYQIDIFKPMIPDSIYKTWLKGLESNSYFMKLCGAGGGGYFFLFSEKKKEELFDFEGIQITGYLSGLVADQ